MIPVMPFSSPISPEPSSAQVNNSPPSKEPSKKTHLPYPQRMKAQKQKEKNDMQLHKFLEMFQKLHFNISLAEALVLMPKGVKCWPDLTGASINLMPLGIYQKLKLPELVTTKMTLELANGSLAIPTGIAEDVLVKVGHFSFPADFVVVDYEVNYRVPLILGRPFLRTARVLIDVHGEELVIRDGMERIVFKPDGSQDKESIHMMDIYDDQVFKYVSEPEINSEPSKEISSICPSIKERLNFWKNKEVLEKNEILKRNNTCDFQTPSSSLKKKEVGGEKNLDVKTIVSFFAPIGNCVRKWATNEFVKDNDEINQEVFKSDNENDLGVHDNEEEEIAFLDGLLEDENFFEMNDKKVESLERKTKEDFETKVEPKSKKELQGKIFDPGITFHEKSFEKDAFKDKSSKELAPSKSLLTLDVFDPLHPPLIDFHVTKALSGFTFSLLQLFIQK
ncbi:reverse transcriptase domain-containing protein [Tanacetum coccineum]|uniref:Reverse transcriptase domain-containing protein n=1 Tax=Tanacetum coccineum TaxID=301880 RepID=A0ABQ5DSU2_9ASTR